MDPDRQPVRLLAGRGWTRTGQHVMWAREGIPELVGLHLWEWRREVWLPPAELVPVLERGPYPTGQRQWLIGSPQELATLGLPVGDDALARRPAATAPQVGSLPWASPRGQGGWTRPDYRFLGSLPHDPPALLADLLAAHPPNHLLGALDQVSAVLAAGVFPAAVVARLAVALRARHEIDTVDDVPDLWERPCTALRQHLGGSTRDLLLDPDRRIYRGFCERAGPDTPTPVPTGTVLRAEVLVTRDDVPPGHIPDDLDG